MLEKRILRRNVDQRRGKEVTGVERNMHNEELHNL
jgi:hypothetical protein